MTPQFNNLADQYLEEELTDKQKKKLLALGLGSALALPGTAYLGQKAGEALRDDDHIAPIVQKAHPQSVDDSAPYLPFTQGNIPTVGPPPAIPGAPPPEGTPEHIMRDINAVATIENYIIGHEDVRHMAYDDGADNPTIGVGHFMTGTDEDRQIFDTLFSQELNYDRLVAASGQVRRGRGVPRTNLNLSTTPRGRALLAQGIQPQAMNGEQVRALFSRDIPVYINRARNNLRTYNIQLNRLSANHQAAWVDLQFRGDFGNELRQGITRAQRERELGVIVTVLQDRARRQRLTHVRNRIEGNAEIIQQHLQELLPNPNR